MDTPNTSVVPASVNPPLLPAMVRTPRGKGFVMVQSFAPTGSASAVKASIKSVHPKISGKALKLEVNKVLRGERSLREQLGIAWVQACYQEHFTPSVGEVGKNSAVLRMVHVEPEAVPIVVTKDSIAKQIAALQEQYSKMS